MHAPMHTVISVTKTLAAACGQFFKSFAIFVTVATVKI